MNNNMGDEGEKLSEQAAKAMRSYASKSGMKAKVSQLVKCATWVLLKQPCMMYSHMSKCSQLSQLSKHPLLSQKITIVATPTKIVKILKKRDFIDNNFGSNYDVLPYLFPLSFASLLTIEGQFLTPNCAKFRKTVIPIDAVLRDLKCFAGNRFQVSASLRNQSINQSEPIIYPMTDELASPIYLSLTLVSPFLIFIV